MERRRRKARPVRRAGRETDQDEGLAPRSGPTTTDLRNELLLDAVGVALFARNPRSASCTTATAAAQYTSYELGRTLRPSGVLASMSRVGSAHDNAMVESFSATLKEELVCQRAWQTRHELEMEVFSYIEGFYNPKSRHRRLDNLAQRPTRRSSRGK